MIQNAMYLTNSKVHSFVSDATMATPNDLCNGQMT